MWFWANSAQTAAKLEAMRQAEARLLKFAPRFGKSNESTLETLDTKIPCSVVPLKTHSCGVYSDSDGEYTMHSVHVSSDKAPHTTPLVFLHGYMNGSAYFYRNLIGLSTYFSSIHSVDLLGWGLSSRPAYKLLAESTENAEDFFVESLEAWRANNNIEKMILAGHSMGGYVSVAYSERYPQRVERLVLLSPVGVPYESKGIIERRQSQFQSSFQTRMLWTIYSTLFYSYSFGDILRLAPTSRSRGLLEQYVERRLPSIRDQEERHALLEYLHCNSNLPGSGEYAIRHLLTPHAFALKPLVDRIPNLKVPHVRFLYGSTDWMDPNGGLQVKDKMGDVKVYSISNAGHLIMLEKFNTGVLLSAGIVPEPGMPLPTELEMNKDYTPESLLENQTVTTAD